MASRPCRRRLRPKKGQFPPPKITLVTLDNTLNDGISIIYFSTFFEFLAASDAMVADERRAASGGEIRVRTAGTCNIKH
jgi:hypothetical protein